MEYKFKVLEHTAGTEDQNMIISSFSRVFSWQYMYVPDWKYRKATEIYLPIFHLKLTDFLFVYVWIMDTVGAPLFEAFLSSKSVILVYF